MTKIFKTFLFIFTLTFVQYPILVLNNFLSESRVVETLQDDISIYEVERKSQSSREVVYEVDYTQEDYWYIYQPDFVKPEWVQKTNSVYGWSSEPTWQWNKTADWDPEEDSEFPPATGSWEWVQVNPDTSSPTPNYSNWSWRNGSGQTPSGSGWEWVRVTDGSWIEVAAPTYGWDSNGYWPPSENRDTENNNTQVFVDWTLYNNSNAVESSTTNLTPSYDGSGNQPTKPANTPPDGDESSPTEPSWTPDKPTHGDPNSASDSEDITISNLALGWDYEFKAELKYVDSNGITKTHSTYEDEFTTIKSSTPHSTSRTSNISEDSLTFVVETHDIQAARSSSIDWWFKEGNNTIETGSSNSNLFSHTVNDLVKNTTYSLEIEYDYKLNSTDVLKYTNQFTYSTSEYTTSEITEAYSVALGNNEFYSVLNIDNEYNHIDDVEEIGINYYENNSGNLIDNSKLDFSEINKGENLIHINDPSMVGPEIKIVPYLVYKTNQTVVYDQLTHVININTNIDNNGNILINNASVTNHDAAINFRSIEKIGSEISTLEYKLSNNSWVDFTDEFISGSRTINLEGLKQDTDYFVNIKALTVDGRIINSNEFSFTTEENSFVELGNISTSTTSVNVEYDIFNVEYIDQKNLEWEILTNNQVAFAGVESFNSSGTNSFHVEGLIESTKYTINARYVFDSKQILLSDSFTTNSNNENIDKGYITGHSFQSSQNQTEATFNTTGNVMAFEYSLDNTNWVELSFTKVSNNQIQVIVPESISDLDVSYFRINYYDDSIYKVDNTLPSVIPVKNVTDWKFIVILTTSLVLGIGTIIAISYSSYLRWNKKNKDNKAIFNK